MGAPLRYTGRCLLMTEMVTLGAYNLVTLGVYNLVTPVCRNNMLPKMIVRSLRMDSNYFFS